MGTGFAQGHSVHHQQSWDESPGHLPLGLSVSGPKVGGKPPKLCRATLSKLGSMLSGEAAGVLTRRGGHTG